MVLSLFSVLGKSKVLKRHSQQMMPFGIASNLYCEQETSLIAFEKIIFT
jgi:hypothetical protein